MLGIHCMYTLIGIAKLAAHPCGECSDWTVIANDIVHEAHLHHRPLFSVPPHGSLGTDCQLLFAHHWLYGLKNFLSLLNCIWHSGTHSNWSSKSLNWSRMIWLMCLCKYIIVTLRYGAKNKPLLCLYVYVCTVWHTSCSLSSGLM